MDMREKLKRQKLRRYALVILAIVVIAGIAIGLSVESKNAKLPDGQGKVTASEEKKTEKKVEKKEEVLSEEEKESTLPQDIKVDNSKNPAASNKGNEALKPAKSKKVTVTVSIRCDTLSQNMDYLENESIREYIPEDGQILDSVSYSGTTENTVFDALNTVCRNNEIQLDFDYTPVYESRYIKGINYIYEFDAGPASGWMFSVNGWYPNYGISNYYLRDGDKIVIRYTCRGYGADIGAD